jgi:hypothetical protein
MHLQALTGPIDSLLCTLGFTIPYLAPRRLRMSNHDA